MVGRSVTPAKPRANRRGARMPEPYRRGRGAPPKPGLDGSPERAVRHARRGPRAGRVVAVGGLLYTDAMPTMDAMVLRTHGAPEVLERERIEIAPPGPREVLVRVRAVAMNHMDLWVRRGCPT